MQSDREEAINLARKHGLLEECEQNGETYSWVCETCDMQPLIDLIAEVREQAKLEERERCAKACDEIVQYWGYTSDEAQDAGDQIMAADKYGAAKECAEAIRKLED